MPRWFGPPIGNCSCCEDDDPDDPCPEKKVCGDPATYPKPITSFRFTASGIQDTWTGVFTRESCSGYKTSIFRPCCEKVEVSESIEWEISGFAGLNGVHDYKVSVGTEPCNDVCDPCTYTLGTRNVRLTGTMTYSYTSTTSSSGGMDCPPITTTINGVHEVCADAGIFVDTISKQATIIIGALCSRVLSGSPPRRPWNFRYFFDEEMMGEDVCSAAFMPEQAGVGDFSAEFDWCDETSYCHGDPFTLLRNPCYEDVFGEECDIEIGDSAPAYSSPSHICDEATFSNDYTTIGFDACSDTESDASTVPGCDPGVAHTDCSDGGFNNSYENRTLEYDGFSDSWTFSEVLAN